MKSLEEIARENPDLSGAQLLEMFEDENKEFLMKKEEDRLRGIFKEFSENENYFVSEQIDSNIITKTYTYLHNLVIIVSATDTPMLYADAIELKISTRVNSELNENCYKSIIYEERKIVILSNMDLSKLKRIPKRICEGAFNSYNIIFQNFAEINTN